MLNLRVLGVLWDAGNRRQMLQAWPKPRRHRVILSHRRLHVAPDIKHSLAEQRLIAIGRMTNGRPAFVAFTLRQGYIRPISARYMRQKEAKRYETFFSESD